MQGMAFCEQVISMEMQEIEFRIDPSGAVSVRVLGGKGETCLEQTSRFEEALGLVEERTYEGEFYESQETSGIRAELKNFGG